jgi:hypothetical protein
MRDTAQILESSCICLLRYLGLNRPRAGAIINGSLSGGANNLPTTMAPVLQPDVPRWDGTTQKRTVYDPNYSPELQLTPLFDGELSPSPIGTHRTNVASSRSEAQPSIGASSPAIIASSPDTRASDTSESHQSSLSPSPGRRARCHGCREIFSSSSNRNRPFKTKCPFGPRERLTCRNPGCDYIARIDNRIRHEKESCSFRVRLQEGED